MDGWLGRWACGRTVACMHGWTTGMWARGRMDDGWLGGQTGRWLACFLDHLLNKLPCPDSYHTVGFGGSNWTRSNVLQWQRRERASVQSLRRKRRRRLCGWAVLRSWALCGARGRVSVPGVMWWGPHRALALMPLSLLSHVGLLSVL